MVSMWLGVLCAGHAFASPWVVPVQGSLTGADGLPLQGTHAVRVALYDSAAGAELWGASQDVAFEDGAFSLALAHDGSIIEDFGVRGNCANRDWPEAVSASTRTRSPRLVVQ
jgi:hypothetical protein